MSRPYHFVSVVVPVYNEEASIGDDLKTIFTTMESLGAPYEVLVIDDGSTDRTRQALDLYPEARVVRHPRNLGVGAARRTGIELARGDVVVTTDGDGTYPNHEIPRLLEAMSDNDMVIGARTREAGTLPWLRRPAKALVRRIAGYLAGTPIPDLNSGLRCFRKSPAESFLHLLPAGHSSESTLTMAFLTNGYRVSFMPVDYYPRRGGRSTFRPVRDTAALLFRMLRNFGPVRRRARYPLLAAAGLLVAAQTGHAAPAAPSLQAPPDGAQLTGFTVPLSWANPPGTTQYYLEVVPALGSPGGPPDGPAITLVRNTETEFTIQPPEMGIGNYVLLPDMTYTWRVSASDKPEFAPPGDASYGPAAQRSFRTPAVSSAEITPMEPADAATANSLTPLLRWQNRDARVFYYEVQLSRDQTFTTGPAATAPVYWELVHGGITGNSYQVREEFSLQGATRYFWRIRPRIQGDGRPVPWSRTFSFTTPTPVVAVDRVFPDLSFQRLTNLVQPDGGGSRLFATEQRGIVRTFTPDSGAATVFLDITDRVLTGHTEEGLLGIAFDPDFRNNGRFFLYYSAGSPSGPRRNVLARFLASEDGSGADPGSEVVLLEFPKPFGNHNGGQIAFGPDGYLYVAVGDGGGAGDPRGNAQNTGSLLGKIHRIDVRGAETYRIPPDNPFVGVAGAREEIWAYGLRNPWRFSWDRASGRMWTADVGQNQWEEIDIVERGRNYGWNIMEGNHCFAPASGCDRSGLQPPVAEYSHDEGCSVTGGFVYRGSQVPGLRGSYLYGDFCTGRVWALSGEGSRHLLDTGLSISSFAEDLAGEVYILDWNNGIYRLVQQ